MIPGKLWKNKNYDPCESEGFLWFVFWDGLPRYDRNDGGVGVMCGARGGGGSL